MKLKNRFLLITGLVLVAALLLTGTAFAEGEAPPPEPAVEEDLPAEPAPPPDPQDTTPAVKPLPAEDTAPADGAVPGEPVAEPPAEEPPLAEVIPTEEVPVEALPAEILPVEEPLEEALPTEGTLTEELVLVDETGQAVDLDSQAASEALATADPYFTTNSGTKTYRFLGPVGACALYSGDFYCADGLAKPIQAAIDYIAATSLVLDNGTLTVEKATYIGAVEIDQTTFPYLTALTKLEGDDLSSGIYPTISGTLTLKNLTTGFWVDGFIVTGGVTIKDSTITGDDITVSNVTGVLTLSNLTVTNTTGNGIHVYSHKGNVTLTNVKSSGNLSYGAWINNSGAAGNVTVTNCSFDRNTGGSNDYGILIDSIGTVTISGLSASYNGEAGLVVQNFSNLSLKNAVLTNNAYDGGYFYTTRTAPILLENVVSRTNGGYGLDIETAGSVTLRSVDTHANNGSYGIEINNSAGTGTVTLTNIRTGYQPYGTGLQVLSHGAITITSIIAENNYIHGAYLDNCDYFNTACRGSGNVTITSLAASGEAGTNEFYDNTHGHGLYISSKGTVTLTNINAYGNSQSGIEITNYRGTGGVTINKNLPNWVNLFDDNGYNGLNITTSGTVSLNDCDVYDNVLTGIVVNGKGTVTLVNVQAFRNGTSPIDSGLYIDNRNGTGGVTIRSSVATNYYNFSSNYWNGICIYSKGAVSVSNVVVNNSQYASGLYIWNWENPTAAPAVTIANGIFNDNHWSGIVVDSKGAITLTNVEACGAQNGQPGVLLENYSHGGAGTVTIRSSIASEIYEFSKNTGEGIRILSRGAVSVSNVNACANQLDGIHIENHHAASDLPVTLTNVVADGNSQNGLFLYSRGAVTLVNTGASNNGHSGSGYYGATISNWNGTAPTGVTIRSSVATANYYFCGNALAGIFIWSEGPVSVGNVVASENGNNPTSPFEWSLSGMYIRRYTGSGAISVYHSTFDHNTFSGLKIESTSCAVTLTDVSASFNDPDPTGTNYSGVDINTYFGSFSSSSVTIKSSLTTNFYDFSYNTDYGILIYTAGPVSVSNVVTEDNNNSGIFIDNHYALTTAPAAVSVLRSTSSGSATGYGFHIYTRGRVTLTDLNANENFQPGVYVNAYDGSVAIPASVTVNGTNNNFDENRLYGIRIETEGAISLSNVSACGTDDVESFSAGISLFNNYTGATAGVTISASTTGWTYACGNDGHGVDISSRGPVVISRLVAVENGRYGGSIQNQWSNPAAVPITISTSNFSRNGGDNGLYLQSLGAVTLNSVSVNSNEHSGLSINTNGLVTLNGVSASCNSIHEGEIPGGSAVITERLTSDSEGDVWYFTAAQVSNTITLSSSDFDAYLVLYWWNTDHWDVLLEDDAQIMIDVAPGSEWKILVTTTDGWGQPGQYTLDLNGGTAVPIEHALGAVINNYTGTGGVTVLSPAAFWSSFNENNYTGLGINTNGAVSITNTSASFNGFDGIRMEGHPLAVSVRNTSTTILMEITDNAENGIYLPSAYGAITLSGRIILNDNGKYGAFMANDGAPIATPMPVTVSGVTANSNKDGDGLYLVSIGQVTISNVIACRNQSTNAGLYVDNTSTAARNLTISGTNLLSENSDAGLNAQSSGVISISGVRAEANGLQGIFVHGFGAAKALTLTNIVCQYNGANGIEARAKGTITFNNVRSNLNGKGVNGVGILVDAEDANPIYFNYCTIIGNEGMGIYAHGSPGWLHLTGTLYFGNDSNWSGDPNIGYW